MSDANVELSHRFIAAWNRHDIEAIIEICDADVEFHSTYAAIGGAVYHGHDELRRYERDLKDAWGEPPAIRMESEGYFDLGQHTLTFQMVYGRGRQSGAGVAMPIAVVLRSLNALIVYVKAYARREDALSDLGVCEDELERIDP
jgi:hypothetical protein